MASKRIARKIVVRDWLVANGPATLTQIRGGTGLSAAAVSTALTDCRNDPALEYVTVPTTSDDYTYALADTVAAMKAGLINQAKHMRTRAESMINAGNKMTAIAVTPDEYALAADLRASGKMLLAQAHTILAAL